MSSIIPQKLPPQTTTTSRMARITLNCILLIRSKPTVSFFFFLISFANKVALVDVMDMSEIDWSFVHRARL